jgi:hypothetical protein
MDVTCSVQFDMWSNIYWMGSQVVTGICVHLASGSAQHEAEKEGRERRRRPLPFTYLVGVDGGGRHRGHGGAAWGEGRQGVVGRVGVGTEKLQPLLAVLAVGVEESSTRNIGTL